MEPVADVTCISLTLVAIFTVGAMAFIWKSLKGWFK